MSRDPFKKVSRYGLFQSESGRRKSPYFKKTREVPGASNGAPGFANNNNQTNRYEEIKIGFSA